MKSRRVGVLSLAAGAVALALTALGFTSIAQAQPSGPDNLDKLKQFKTSGADLTIPSVPQEGKKADAVRENLKRITLPPGFEIELYAIVPDARHLAVAPSTNMVFVGTTKTKVWAVTDRDSDGVADEVKQFAPSLTLKVPDGVCWTRDGFLIVVEQNRVLSFPAAEFFEGPDVAAGELVPQGKLIPPTEESFNHGSRVCRVGKDGKLYIALGQPFNVPPRDKLDLYNRVGMGGIIRMNANDGSDREVFARGIRNSVGMDFNPKDGSLWFTDNQTDGMGDDTPPGELNRATKAGMNFGYPWLGGKSVRITEHGYDKDDLPPDLTPPQIEFQAHAADLGMTFYTGTKFPEKYRGGIFSAQHGSWNRTVPVGAQIMFTSLKPDGTADKTEVFAKGWLDNETETYRGRPVDVAQMKDGSILVSDDFAGAIYRISYVGQ